jgi:hypothetical protein
MNFLKTLDKALDFDSLEQKVQQAASAVVEEFPDRSKAAPTSAKVVVTTACESDVQPVMWGQAMC